MSNNKTGFHIESDEQDICSGFLYWHKRTPNAPALVIDGTSYSYKELYDAAFSMYTDLDIFDQDNIGVYCTNDLYSYAAILAVSMSGAAYVPLNSKFSIERINRVAENCMLSLIISKTNLDLDKRFEVISPSLKVDYKYKPVSYTGARNAYVLYTSGTTGEPKGVPVKKSSVNSFFRYYLDEFDFNSNDRFLQPYELSFDVSVFSMFCAWNVGAAVYPVKEGAGKFIETFKTIGENKITVCSMVPGILSVMKKYFKDFNFPSLRYSFFSGDALYHDLAKEWSRCIPNAELHNFYGPTETTIVCTHYKWNEELSAKESVNGIVPLGKAFPGMEFILIDESKNKVADGVGELCFSGKQVIDAYLNDVSESSFFKFQNKRYYKTGDWCSVNKNGNLIFHGRKDKQVKINGYRVELTEVENAIREVNDAACIVMVYKMNGTDQLVAFVEKESGHLKEELNKLLPEYMIPTRFIYIKQLPFTINSKIDEEELKALLNG